MRPLFCLVPAFVVLSSLGVVGCSADGDPASGSAEDDVVTKRCPATLDASFSSVISYSMSEIERRHGFALQPWERDELKAPLARLRALQGFQAKLVLDKAAKAECRYVSADPSRKTTAKFYTRAGKDILRFDGNDANDDLLSFYVQVKDYSPTSVTTSFEGGGVFYRSEHSEVNFVPYDIGRATKATVSVGGPAPAATIGDAQIETGLRDAVQGIEYTSESDVPFAVFRAPIAATEKVDAKTVLAKFSGLAGTESEDENGKPLALKDMPGTKESPFAPWFEDELTDDASDDATTKKYKEGMRKVHQIMTTQLTDLKVVYVASEDISRSMDVGLVQIFLVGRSKDGSLFAVHTAAVWT